MHWIDLVVCKISDITCWFTPNQNTPEQEQLHTSALSVEELPSEKDNIISSNLIHSVHALEDDMKCISEEISTQQEVDSEEPTINVFFTGCKRTEFSFSPTTLLSEVLAMAIKNTNTNSSDNPADYCLVRTTQHNLPLPLTKSLADISIESGTRLSCMLMHCKLTYS